MEKSVNLNQVSFSSISSISTQIHTETKKTITIYYFSLFLWIRNFSRLVDMF